MDLIEAWAPTNEGNSVGNAFMLASLTGREMGIILKEDGVITQMKQRMFVQADKRFDLSMPELYPPGHPVMVCIARPSYAFSPNVADAEIDLWEKPIKDHPNSIRILEMVAATRKGSRHWIANYEISTSGVSFSVFEIDFTNSIDPRFADESKLPDDVIETLGITIANETPAKSNGAIPFRKV